MATVVVVVADAGGALDHRFDVRHRFLDFVCCSAEGVASAPGVLSITGELVAIAVPFAKLVVLLVLDRDDADG